MKICINCGRQLFDRDYSCDKCNSQNIVSEEDYNRMVEDIKNANIFIKKKLLQNDNYKCIYNRLQQPEVSYPKPVILNSNNHENDKDYWERIEQHTINKSISTIKIIECPYCKSANTTKISTTAKVVNTAIFGIFGTKRHKQWHCNTCNSDF